MSPPSITYGADSFESTGSDLAAVDHDLKLLLTTLTTAGMSLQSATWVTSPEVALGLSLMRGGGALAYPGVGPRGGTLLNLPLLVSSQAKASASPAENIIALIEANEVLYADDGRSDLSISSNAAVQMDDAPAAGEQNLVSLWQNNLIAIRAVRYMNWMRRRTGSVAVLRSVQL